MLSIKTGWGYTMTFIWISTELEWVNYSNLTQIKTKGALLQVLGFLFCFQSVSHKGTLSIHSWGCFLNQCVVFGWKEEMKKGFTIQLNAENKAEGTPHHTAADDHQLHNGGDDKDLINAECRASLDTLFLTEPNTGRTRYPTCTKTILGSVSCRWVLRDKIAHADGAF